MSAPFARPRGRPPDPYTRAGRAGRTPRRPAQTIYYASDDTAWPATAPPPTLADMARRAAAEQADLDAVRVRHGAAVRAMFAAGLPTRLAELLTGESEPRLRAALPAAGWPA